MLCGVYYLLLKIIIITDATLSIFLINYPETATKKDITEMETGVTTTKDGVDVDVTKVKENGD